MLELATNVEKQTKMIITKNYKDKWLMKNLIQRTGSKTDDVIEEIKAKEIEDQTIIVSGTRSKAHLDNVRQVDIEYLSLNDIQIINDIFSIFTKYKYLVFDSLQIKENEKLNVYKNIYALADKHKEVVFLWVGETGLVEQVYNMK